MRIGSDDIAQCLDSSDLPNEVGLARCAQTLRRPAQQRERLNYYLRARLRLSFFANVLDWTVRGRRGAASLCSPRGDVFWRNRSASWNRLLAQI